MITSILNLSLEFILKDYCLKPIIYKNLLDQRYSLIQRYHWVNLLIAEWSLLYHSIFLLRLSWSNDHWILRLLSVFAVGCFGNFKLTTAAVVEICWDF